MAHDIYRGKTKKHELSFLERRALISVCLHLCYCVDHLKGVLINAGKSCVYHGEIKEHYFQTRKVRFIIIRLVFFLLFTDSMLQFIASVDYCTPRSRLAS